MCRNSSIKGLGTIWVNYTENYTGAEDTACTLCWVCQERSGVTIIGVLLWTTGKYYASMKPLGNLNLLFPFLPKPAKWDLLGLFWVCWRIIFPCAVVGRETAMKSAAKPTWAELNWWDSRLLQCSVIPDDTMLSLSILLFVYVCLFPVVWSFSSGLASLGCLVVSRVVCFYVSYSLISFVAPLYVHEDK